MCCPNIFVDSVMLRNVLAALSYPIVNKREERL